MKKQDCYYIGKIVSKFSFKGEVLLKLETKELADYRFKTLFVEIDGLLSPFIVEKFSKHKTLLLRLRLADIDSELKALSLIKKNIYIETKDLPRSKKKKFYFNEIIGFKIIDLKIGIVGKITNIDSQTPQTIALVENDKKQQIIIPLVDEFIIKIDNSNQEITVNLPDGMTELNL